MAKEKRDAWERDVEKMRQIIAAQGCHSFLSLVFSSLLAGAEYPTVSPCHPSCSCLPECGVITIHNQVMQHLYSPSISGLSP